MSFGSGLMLLVGIPLMHIIGFLVSMYLNQTGVLEKHILPLFTDLGLNKSLVPWATIFVVFLEIQILGSVLTVIKAFSGKYDNSNPRAAPDISHDEKDNSNPRVASDISRDFVGRLTAARLNLLENLTIYAVVLIIAHIAKVPLSTRISFSLIYMAARLIYPIIYAIDLDLFRSAIYHVSNLSVIILFLFVLLNNAKTDINNVYNLFTQPIADAFLPLQTQIQEILKA